MEDNYRRDTFIAAFVTQCTLSAVIVGLRLWSRIYMSHLGADDIFIVLTLLLFVALTVLSVILALNGGTRHMALLGDDMWKVVRLIYIAQPWGIMAVALGKVSAGFLIMRIINKTHKWMRVSIWVMIAITIITNILSAVTTFTQCNPPAALWDPVLRRTATCWVPQVQSNINIWTSSWNTFVDFVLALMPIRIIWGLKLRMGQRIGIIFLLSVGVFSGVCSAIKTSKLASLTERSDLTWETYSLFLWVSAEVFVIVLCASLSTLKPLYDRLRGKRLDTTRSNYSSSYQLSGNVLRSKSRSARDEFGQHVPLASVSEEAIAHTR
ncbi:unnamed protein product [Clonostachys rosea]|uniref:Rhodopsin domain-containing protein n=1 Tax=Bionectria ochroleuca TaxID=29856 RepID=A0ABY6ULS3_BIOOC|nr:unnamed protein product [Clonostachys rosea]